MSVELISEYDLNARKHHRCFHCHGWIVPGQKHRKSVLKYDDVYTLRSHYDCDALWATYEADAGFNFYDFPEGFPPLIEDWMDSGEFHNLCNAYRGQFPHAVTRMEYHDQISELRYEDRLRERGAA